MHLWRNAYCTQAYGSKVPHNRWVWSALTQVLVRKWSALMRTLWMNVKTNYFSCSFEINLTSDLWGDTGHTRMHTRVLPTLQKTKVYTHAHTHKPQLSRVILLGSSFPKVRVGCALWWKSFTDWIAWCNLVMVKTPETLTQSTGAKAKTRYVYMCTFFYVQIGKSVKSMIWFKVREKL